MKFSDIPGHEEVKTLLRSLADGGRIPHAILIEGPAGVGKHALARAFLQYVGCDNRREGDSCGVCPSCRQHESMQHIDTVYSFPYVKRKNSTSVSPTLSSDYLADFIQFVKNDPFLDHESWLEVLGSPNTHPQIFVEEANELIRRLSFASHSSPYNSVLIWQVDKLNETASNKLLKVIEEPPGQAVIIMTTDKPMNILPTIYSRTQRVKVKRLSDDEVTQWLVNKSGCDADESRRAASLAEGSVTRARKMLEKRDDSRKFLDYFIELMRKAYMRDIGALKTWSQNLAAESRSTIVDFLTYAARMLRENYIANLRRESLNVMTDSESQFSANFARFINERNVEALFTELNKAADDIARNVNPRIVLFDFAITVILKLKQ